jgi:hypothetical protein
MSQRRPHTESELVELVRSIDARAPDSLHRQVESLIASSSRRRRRPSSVRWLGVAPRVAAGALAAAVVAIAVAISLGGSSSSTLSLRQASALALSGATARAPRESPGRASQLAASVEGVSFPYWEEHFGWRASGSRTDHVGGRAVTTVFYADRHGHRIGYAIASGVPAPTVRGGVIAWRRGVPYRELVEHGTQVVTWLRDGHLCVVSGRGVDGATLLALASWNARGSVTA